MRSFYEEECGILLNSEGPFANCHRVVDPQSAYDSCVADMCNMDGDEDTKNRVFSSYVHDCMELLREPTPWRADQNLRK